MITVVRWLSVHPEFTSTPRDGHPLFTSFVKAAITYSKSGDEDTLFS